MSIKKEAKTCWEFWNCNSIQKCPEARYSTGKYCWELAGTGCKNEFCIKLASQHGTYRFCWECSWFKIQNPDFFPKQENEKKIDEHQERILNNPLFQNK